LSVVAGDESLLEWSPSSRAGSTSSVCCLIMTRVLGTRFSQWHSPALMSCSSGHFQRYAQALSFYEKPCLDAVKFTGGGGNQGT